MNNLDIIEEINAEIARIINKVKKEYEEFKEHYISLTSLEVFEAAFEINAMTDFFYFFDNDGFGEMINNKISLYENNKQGLNYIYINLTKMNKNILNTLYHTMINTDELYSNTWEDIEEVVEETYFFKD